MKLIGTHIREMQSGGFKADIWGQPSSHIMDWNGCNFRFKPLPGQPLRGFKTMGACKAWLISKWTDDTIKEFSWECGDGTFFTDGMSAVTTEFKFPKA